jgi:tetratricopeptide (TPR) repeat protein
LAVGDTRQGIDCLERSLVIAQEIGDVISVSIGSFNLALRLYELGRPDEALRYAEEAAQGFAKAGHTSYAEQAQQWIARIRRQKL